MFVLQDVVTIWWPVEVKVPDAKVHGRFVTQQFEAEFKVLNADDGQARMAERAEVLGGKESDEDEAERPVRDVVKELQEFDFATWATIVLDWRGVQDADRQEVPFSDDLLIKAVKQPLTRKAFERAYAEILSGEPKKGNSAKRP